MYFPSFSPFCFAEEKTMPCACHKKGSGGKFLSGVTWKGYGKGSGLNFAGSGLRKRRRRRKKASGVSFVGSGLRKRRKKKASGLSFRGSGVSFTGSGYVLSGSGGYKRLVGVRK